MADIETFDTQDPSADIAETQTAPEAPAEPETFAEADAPNKGEDASDAEAPGEELPKEDAPKEDVAAEQALPGLDVLPTEEALPEDEAPKADDKPVEEPQPSAEGEEPAKESTPVPEAGPEDGEKEDKPQTAPVDTSAASGTPAADGTGLPAPLDTAKPVTTDDVEAEHEEEQSSEDAPAGAGEGAGNTEEDSVQAAPLSGDVTAPTEVIEQGTAPDWSTLSHSTQPSTGCQVKVGEDHVAEGINADSVGQAIASFFLLGESLADWLGAQGLAPYAAPGLVAFAADKHGADARLPTRQWSLVVQEFYAS